MTIAESSLNRKKMLPEKEKLLHTSYFSFSHSVFKRLVLQTCKNQGLFGKGLSIVIWMAWLRWPPGIDLIYPICLCLTHYIPYLGLMTGKTKLPMLKQKGAWCISMLHNTKQDIGSQNLCYFKVLNKLRIRPQQGLTLTHDRPTLSACCSVRSGWTRQIQAQMVVLISYQHSSFINSFVYDCKLTFLLVERMTVLDYCLLFYHICYGRACVTSPGNPAWLVPVFSLSLTENENH